jgi:VIT1/CCC1 family predicted Fe2+/Mn2+ transporter
MEKPLNAFSLNLILEAYPMEKLLAALTSIPMYPKGAFLVLFAMYFTHLTH